MRDVRHVRSAAVANDLRALLFARGDEPENAVAVLARDDGTHVGLAIRTVRRPHPDGKPASWSNWVGSTGLSGPFSLGLRTNAFPRAMASGNIHSGTIAGKLNGVIPAHTPSGRRSKD